MELRDIQAGSVIKTGTSTTRPDLPFTQDKRWTTVCLAMSMFAYGFAAATTPPSLYPGIGIRGNAATIGTWCETVALGITTFCYGLVVKNVHRPTVLLLLCLIAAINLMVTANVGGLLWLFFLVKTVSGVTAALIAATCVTGLFQLWDKASGPYIHLLILGLNLGIMGGATILSPDLEDNILTNAAKQQAVLVYGIAATPLFVSAIALAVLSFCCQVERTSLKVCEGGKSGAWTVAFLGMGAVIIVLSSAIAVLNSRNLASYLQFFKPFQFQLMMRISGVAAIAAIVASAFLSINVRPALLVLCATALTLSGNLLLILSVVFRETSVTMWTGLITLSAGRAIISPCAFAFMQEKTSITNAFVGMAMTGETVIRVLLDWTADSMRSWGQQSFLFLNIGFTIGIMLLILVMLLTARCMKP